MIRTANILIEDHLRTVSSPANLRINDQITFLREECRKHGCERPYHHFAFGQSPFPPPPTVVEALAANAERHSYLPTAGLPQLRETIAEYYRRNFGFDCESAQVVIGPGSKQLISGTVTALQGAVLVPTPSWVSYIPQAKILKKEVISLRTRREDGFKVTPELLKHALRRIQAPQTILILNHPHNPTGAVYSESELEALTEVCRKHGIIVISDEIYARTSFEPERFTSLAKVYPEGTIVTGGLSKDRSCGGYRFGVGIFPIEAKELVADVLKVGGSTYSCVAAPIQYAALEAYSGNEEVENYVRDCWKVNALVGKKMASLLAGIPGVKTSTPHGAYYLYVDLMEQREQFQRLGFKTCSEFCEDLLHVEHTALLPGDALLLPKDDFSVRCSYVDYDGKAALAQWRSKPPSTPQEEDDFVRENCPLIVDGVDYIQRYISEIRRGNRPQHLGMLPHARVTTAASVREPSRSAHRFAAIKLGLGIAALATAIAAAWAFRIQDRLREVLEWISSLGFWGPSVFVGIYILATVLFIPGSILTLGAGVLFGVVGGTIAVSLASTIGACIAFLVGRYLVRGWVSRKVDGNPKFRAIDEAVAGQGWKIVLLTRLSPVFPFNLLNYAFGLTKVKFRSYALASWIGMFPGTVMYVYIGSALGELANLGAGGRTRTSLEWAFYGLGLAATIVVTVFVTRIARRALRQAVANSEGEHRGDI